MSEGLLSHPYYPLDLELNEFHSNTYSVAALVGAWLIALSSIILVAYTWLSTTPRKLTGTEKVKAIWFITCGFIHFFFEGHFARRHDTMASDTDLLSQEWKEYSKADSRYLTSDPLLVIMESVTAWILGPLCFYIAWGIAYRYASRYVLIALVSAVHIYSNLLYYGTTLLEGAPATRPEFLYFWIYFVGLNGVWMIAPHVLLIHSVRKINQAIAESQRRENTKKDL